MAAVSTAAQGGASTPAPAAPLAAGAPQSVKAAADILARELVAEEVLSFDDRFLDADGRPDQIAIFDWLLDVEKRHDGVVSLASVGQDGSRWLLAQKLGETLQDVVRTIGDGVSTIHALADMSEALQFQAMMSTWRMNDQMQFERLLAEVTKKKPHQEG